MDKKIEYIIKNIQKNADILAKKNELLELTSIEVFYLACVSGLLVFCSIKYSQYSNNLAKEKARIIAQNYFEKIKNNENLDIVNTYIEQIAKDYEFNQSLQKDLFNIQIQELVYLVNNHHKELVKDQIYDVNAIISMLNNLIDKL